MDISDAQRDVRRTFLGGFAGQLVSSVLWFVSAALATWSSPRNAIIILVVGGMFIFPLTQVLLRVMGRRPSLGAGHPMYQVGMQVAFTLPLNLPLVAAATMYRLNWFYPAFMIALGTHYLPFDFLYGMRLFTVLAVLLIGAGVALGVYVSVFSLGAWLTAIVLLIFAFIGRAVARRDEA